MKLSDHMRLIDPNYGSQKHQQVFLSRMKLLQEREPCNTDHIHETRCYSARMINQLIAEEKS